MNEEKYLSISEFAKLSDVSRKALIYYDRIGLFSPEYVKPNGYRCYTHRQIETISLINTLSGSGMSLEDIKRYLNECSPQKALDLFQIQQGKLDDEIHRLRSVKDMLSMRTKLINESLKNDDEIRLVTMEDTPFYISPAFHNHTKSIPGEVWIDFYNTCEKEKISYGYPACYVINKEDLISQKSYMISHIGIQLCSPRKANHIRKNGTYLVCYSHCHYGETDSIYNEIFQYIRKKNLSVSGNSYEEYLLDEVTTADPSQYRVKISIPVRI